MTQRPARREFLVALAALAGSGCFGKFAATHALYDWNKDVSDNKWLRWLVFLVLVIIPVYELFILADAVVINTIEFFTDDNPVDGGRAKLPEGHTLASSRTNDPNVIRHEHRKDGEVVQVIFVRRVGDDEMQLLNADKQVVGRARLATDGAVEIFDAEGKLIRRTGAQEQARIGQALGAGVRPSEAWPEAPTVRTA